MFRQMFEQRVRSLVEHNRQLIQFLLLAAFVAAATVVAHTVATALFLTSAGSEAMPVFYVLLGLLSIPVSFSFSKIIDQSPRLWLFRCLLLGALVLVGGLRLLLMFDALFVYFAIYISLSLIELLCNVLLWTLVSDYFTLLEQKQFTPLISMAITVGGLSGGLLARLFSDLVSTRNLLWGLPLLYAGAIAQLILLERSGKATEVHTSKDSETQMLKSLRAFPRLLARYPIILLLAASTVVSVQLWGTSELQFFTIYSQNFPDQGDLAGFLGLLSALFSALELGISYFITRPLLQWWGVRQMNLIYPITTLVSFLGLAFSFRLPAAIAANINYDPLYSSIAHPIQNLTYNAIPPRFAGRVRVILDGLLYPACQAITGAVLLLEQETLDSFWISMTGVGLSGILLVFGFLIGRSYLKAMLLRLRSGSLNFGEVSEGLAQLPDEYGIEIQQLLTSQDPAAHVLGLELAIRVKNPSQFLSQVQMLLQAEDPKVQQAVLTFLTAGNQPDFYGYLQIHLTSESEIVRATVLEALIATQQSLSKAQLCFLLEDPSPTVRALACVATWQKEVADAEIWAIYQTAWHDLKPGGFGQGSEKVQQIMIRAIHQAGDRQLVPLLQKILIDAGDRVKCEGLNTLASLANRNDESLADLGIQELTHSDPLVRAAAVKLLRVICSDVALVRLVDCLEDPNPMVRQEVIAALAAYGESSLPWVEPYLLSVRPEVVDAAIATIGSIGTRRAEDMLFQYLQPKYREAEQTLRWQQQIPADVWYWQPLAIALQDYHSRLMRQVLHILFSLGNAQLLEGIDLLLHSSDLRLRMNASETLASLSQRRFVQPILPLLEYQAAGTPFPQRNPDQRFHQELSTEMLQISDRWIRIGSLIALTATQSKIPSQILADPDPLVQQVATRIADSLPHQSLTEEPFLSRLFFLKQVFILQSLSLDDLLLVDRTLKETEFLKEEIIVKEGSRGGDFYILYRGSVAILKRMNSKNTELTTTRMLFGERHRELAYLEPGQFFGDMEFFDNLPRSATAIAETDCTLLTLEKNDFQNLLTQRPEIALQMCKVLSMRLRETNKYLEE